MARKKIIWSKRAKHEFHDILDYYKRRNRSNTYNNKLFRLTLDLITKIQFNEKIGRPTSVPKVYMIPLKVFLIIYEIESDRIEILSFWDNRQNPKKRIV